MYNIINNINNNKHNSHLSNAYSVPGTAISTSHALSHLVIRSTQQLFFDANYLIHIGK